MNRFAKVAWLVMPFFAEIGYAAPPVHSRVVDTGDFRDARSSVEEARVRNAVRDIQNLRASANQTSTVTDLAWPLQPVSSFDQFDYHGTSNFVDHDPRFPGLLQDYTCGTRTYDTADGYNHAGTDYYLWPFPWLMMDEGVVQVVAAAPGVISRKDDGYFDRDCALQSSTNPNDIYVLQDDGLTAIYYHLRNGSVTSKPLGSRVAAGDYLGLVGSSGNSTGPHLHFELRDSAGNVVDPRHGQCNASPDRWAVFQAYEDPHIVSLSTHSLEPSFVTCGVDQNGKAVDEVPSYKREFDPGDELWVLASYRDHRNGEITHFSITRPDGSLFQQWDFDLAGQNNPKPFYSGTAQDWKFTLPTDALAGTWTLSVQFQGQSYTRTFSVSGAAHGASVTLGGYLSGSWYDPNQSGQGFQLELTANNHTMIAIWFVYSPEGSSQNWIYAQGTYDPASSTVTLPAIISSGAKFPPAFKSSDVIRTDWGTLTFTFSDCNTAKVDWNSKLAEYGSGSLSILRLTQIDGTVCPSSSK